MQHRPSSLESPDALYHGSGVKRSQGKEKVEVKPLRRLIRESHTREIPHSRFTQARAHMQMRTNAIKHTCCTTSERTHNLGHVQSSAEHACFFLVFKLLNG